MRLGVSTLTTIVLLLCTKSLLWLSVFSLSTSPAAAPQNVGSVSPIWLVLLEERLVVLGKQEQVGSGLAGREAGGGEACVHGGTCASEDGAHYLGARVTSSFCQNGELKHRL